MQKQVKTRKVTVSSVMGRRDFVEGMNDARLGKPVRDQWESTERGHVIDRQWSYERGRAFYVFLKSIGMENTTIKNGRSVTRQAQMLFSDAWKQGWVI
jgi:hypothetical protein